MIKRVIYLMAIVLLLTACGQSAQLQRREDGSRHLNKIIASFENAKDGKVLVVAHRGYYKHCPENSIPSILSAVELGVDIVEIDVSETKDGRLVLMHDNTINRTTTGKGKVADLTLSEIKKYHLRYRDGSVSKEKVPTLEETFEALRGKCLINLDKSEKCLKKCLDFVEKLNMGHQVILKGSGEINEVKKMMSATQTKAYYGPIVFCKDLSENEISFKEYKKGIKTIKPEMLEIVIYDEGCSLITKEAEEFSDRYDVRIWCNSLFVKHGAGHVDSKALLDPDGHWGWLIDQGVDIIQTDEAAALLEYLRSKNLHD